MTDIVQLLSQKNIILTERKRVVTKPENYSYRNEKVVMETNKCMNETENLYEWRKKFLTKIEDVMKMRNILYHRNKNYDRQKSI